MSILIMSTVNTARINENHEENNDVRGMATLVPLLPARRNVSQNTQSNSDLSPPLLRNRAAARKIRTKSSNLQPASKITRSIPCSLMTAVANTLSEIPLVLDIDVKTNDFKYDKNYAKEIMVYLRELEVRRKLPDFYLESSQPPFTPATRSILIDWLIQVQHYLKLHQETLYLATNIFDHFSVKSAAVAPEKLQLLLLASLLIACKLHERFTPELKVLEHLADDAYTKEQFMKMEEVILMSLKFELVMPDPMVFLDRCLQVANHKNVQLQHLSTFFMDVVLPDAKICKVLPSKLAAAAHCLARKILCKGEAYWDRTLDHYSGYTKENVSDLMLMIATTVMEAPKSSNQGAIKKYASKSRYQALSELPVLKPEAMQNLLSELETTK